MTVPAQTTGLGVAAKISAIKTGFISLSGSGSGPYAGAGTTLQLEPIVEDVSGAVQSVTSYTLSAAANASAGTTVYTGTGFPATVNALKGFPVAIAGFVTNVVNNGDFEITASTSTTITVTNAAGVAESHAATAAVETSAALTYVSYNQGTATVSATGLVTGVAKGVAIIEVSFPSFSNTIGNIAAGADNIMTGLPINKIYAEVNVFVGV